MSGAPERELVGIREYARRRGVSHTAVRKAISTGRIAGALVKVEGRKGPAIDVASADKLWALNTDQSQQRQQAAAAASSSSSPSSEEPKQEAEPQNVSRSARGGKKASTSPGPANGASPPAGAPEPRAAEPSASVTPGRDLFDQPLEEEVEDGSDSEPTFASVRVVRETWAGRMAELRYQQAAGALVSADRVRDLFFQKARAVRSALLALPVRLAPDLAAETSSPRIEERLRVELENALGELSGGLES